MRARPSIRRGVAWLELLFVLAFLALLFQVFPSLWRGLVWALDARHWSHGAWFGVNLGVILALFAIRFRSELKAAWRAILASMRASHTKGSSQRSGESDADYQDRSRRDAEWRERARKRLPFT